MFKKFLLSLILTSSLTSIALAETSAVVSMRRPLFTNEKTKVWETIIYPYAKQKLSLHRHEYDRVVIALSDGVLKVTDNTGASHLLKLNQGQAYFLPRDKPKSFHTDENLGTHEVKVIVVELRYA